MNANTKQKKIKIPEQDHLPAGLYIVATPIGNLRDITLRALDVLGGVEQIACEDTRVSGKLLKHYDISKPLISYNDHSDEKKRARILKDIQEGKSVALISDAGCPLISDPGFKLVRQALEQDISVTSIPGASAVITGLQLSGLPSDQFSFLGFLPNKQKARKDTLSAHASLKTTLIFYETGPRLLASLKDMFDVFGARTVCVARELTKLHEQVLVKPIPELLKYYEEKGAPKGEIVLVIEGAEDKIWSDIEVEESLCIALQAMPTKQAAQIVAEQSGRPRKEIYTLALELNKKS